MFDPNTLEVLLLKAAIGIAGIAGSAVHIVTQKPNSVWEAFQIIFTGLVSAVFLAPFFLSIIPFVDHTDPEMLTGGGFVIGIFGIYFVRIIIRTGQIMSEGEGFKSAFAKALTSYVTKRGAEK